jgi:hypothetical protein
MAEREGVGRHGGEVRGPRRRRVRLLREEAPDLSGGWREGGGDSGHPGGGDRTPAADGGEAVEERESEWKTGRGGVGRRPAEGEKNRGVREPRGSEPKGISGRLDGRQMCQTKILVRSPIQNLNQFEQSKWMDS